MGLFKKKMAKKEEKKDQKADSKSDLAMAFALQKRKKMAQGGGVHEDQGREYPGREGQSKAGAYTRAAARSKG